TARSSGRKRQRLGGSPRQFAPGRAFSAIGTALSSVAGKIAKAQQGALAGARAAAPHVGRTSSAAGAKALFAAVWTGRMAASLAVLLARGLWWLVLHLTQLLARSAVLLARGIRWLAPRAGRALVAGVRLMAGGARSASAAMAARRQAAREAQAAKAAAAVVSASAAAEPAGPAVASATLAEEPGMGELVGAGAAPASGLADMWASAAATAGVDAGEKMTAPVVPASVAKLEELLAEGLATLDRGQETLAYHMFVTATEAKAPRDGGEQYVDLMKRAWFWRAKTAETVEDLVFSLEQALRFDPQNLQMQAHLAWARQRLEREQKLVPAGEEAAPATSHQTRDPRPETRNPSWWTAIGESVRVVGGLLALALAALWATTGVLPALSR